MATKRQRSTGSVMALRLPTALDNEIRCEAQRLKVRPVDLARLIMAQGWAHQKTRGAAGLARAGAKA